MQKIRRKHNLDTKAHQTHNNITVSPRHYSKPVLTGFICWAGYDEIRVGKSAHVINIRAVSSHYPITRTWLSSEKKQNTYKDQDTREIPLNSEKVKLKLSSLCFFAIFLTCWSSPDRKGTQIWLWQHQYKKLIWYTILLGIDSQNNEWCLLFNYCNKNTSSLQWDLTK